MELSSRAKTFLSKQERRSYIGDRSRIIAALEKAHLPIFDPVIAFQQNYGGYTFHAGLEPLVYGIIHSEPRSTAPNVVSGEEDEDVWYFECVDTLYQMGFHIDQSGRYFEDRRAIFSSMDKFVESEAFSHELASEGNWRPIQIELPFPVNAREDLSRLGLRLHIVTEASDEFTNWWIGNTLCIHIRGEKLQAWSRPSGGDQVANTLHSSFL